MSRKELSLMAEPTPVNGQITDAIALTHFLTVGAGPGVAVAAALMAMSHAAGLAMLNAVDVQQNWSTGQQAATLVAVNEILAAGGSPEAAAAAPATGKGKS
jgi:Killing trait